MSHNSSRQLWDSCTAAQGMQATLLHSRLLGSGFFCVCFFVVCLFPPPTAGNPVSDLQVKLTLVLRYPLFAGSWADPSGRARAGGPGQGAGAGAALRGSCRLGARSLGCRAQPSPEPALTLWGVRAPRGCWEHNGERLCLHGSSCRAGNWLYHSFQIFTLYRSPNILKLDSQRCLQIACQHRASRIRQRADQPAPLPAATAEVVAPRAGARGGVLGDNGEGPSSCSRWRSVANLGWGDKFSPCTPSPCWVAGQ